MKKVLILVSSIFAIFLVGCQKESDVSVNVKDEMADVQVSPESGDQNTEELASMAQKNTDDSMTDTETVIIESESVPSEDENSEPLADIAAPGIIEGNITTTEPVTLPQDAVVTVTLEDISSSDVPAEVVSEQTFVVDGVQIPFDFELNFDENKIEPNHKYSIRAKVEFDGKLKLTTDKVYSVITDENGTKKVNLSLVGV
ncbi:hypothetical protein DI392_03755 [Vibrio albus]|uniref:Lipoprotein n=1 Tax=Vibrio albus TaxID=2200953 RepID=A0A2U3BBR7_9VIBR|nr:YbaY family lipoprotein [Vibrio albus]PWI34242.1 hypothetical protein DI392_03755 [Vibrio albus]